MFSQWQGRVAQAAGALFDVNVSDGFDRILGRVRIAIANTLRAGGRVVAPGAGVAVATLAAPPAGAHEVTVAVAVGPGGLAADAGNMELREGAAVLCVLACPAPGAAQVTLRRHDLNGDALTVNATAAATAGVPYAATIVATRVE